MRGSVAWLPLPQLPCPDQSRDWKERRTPGPLTPCAALSRARLLLTRSVLAPRLRLRCTPGFVGLALFVARLRLRFAPGFGGLAPFVAIPAYFRGPSACYFRVDGRVRQESCSAFSYRRHHSKRKRQRTSKQGGASRLQSGSRQGRRSRTPRRDAVSSHRHSKVTGFAVT